MHTVPGAPRKPWGHLQSWSNLLPGDETERAGHGEQELNFDSLKYAYPKKSALQMQLVLLILPFERVIVLPGQEVQRPPLVLSLYVPSGHGRHAPVSAPYKPGSHKQSVISVLFKAEVEFAGHSAHSPLPTSDL